MNSGSIEYTAARLASWCQRAPKGFAKVEYDSEPARAEVLRLLRSALASSNVPVHEIRLPAGMEPSRLVQGLLERLGSVHGGVVSISGFAAALADGRPPEESLAIFNFNRENLARPDVRQIWWMPRDLAEKFTRSVPDLDSWFLLRLELTETMPVQEPAGVILDTETRAVDPRQARERAQDLIARARNAIAKGSAVDEVWRKLVAPAVDLLRSAGLEKEARDWAFSLRREIAAARPPSSPPKVFISYSHDSREHQDHVLELANRLSRDGIDAVLDQYEESPPGGWPRWMEAQIDGADFVLMICTETYRRRVMGKETPGKGLGVRWEGNLIYQRLYDAGALNTRFIPVLLGSADVSEIPDPAQGATYYRADTEEGYDALYRRLTNQPRVQKPELGKLRSLAPRERKQQFRPWNLPFDRNPFFTGRAKILDDLHSALGGRGRQAISGLGGVGKTQTAIEYAYRHEGDYSTVLWARGHSEDALNSSYSEIARLLDLPEKDAADLAEAREAVKRWLESNTAWLLIIDNADQPEILKPWLPRHGKGHILLTSRAQVFQSVGIANPVEIQEMTPGEAVEFLFKRTGRQDGDRAESKAAGELARELGYLPLALEQAAAYITEKKARFQDYAASYQKRRLELLAKGKPVAGDYPESVATTWSLNFDEVEKTPASADLLRFSAFLSPDHIPLELIEKGASELGAAICEALRGVADDPLALDEVLDPAARFSLIRRDVTARTYSIHRLVQEVVRTRMDSGAQRTWAERTVGAVNRAFPSPEYGNWELCERLLPHAREAVGLIELWRFDSSESALLLNNLGFYLKERAQLGEAERLYRRSLEIAEKLYGPEHPSVAARANNIGTVLLAKRDLEGALRYTQRALVIGEKVYGPEHSEVAAYANNIGQILQAKGDLEGALRYSRQALEIDEKVHGPEHPNVATFASNIGQILQAKGDLEDALRYTQQGLEIGEKVYGTEHPNVATFANNMGQILQAKGDLEGALCYAQRALEIDEKVYGPEHPNVARDASNIGLILNDKADLEEALRYALRALEIDEKVYGPEHPKVAICANNIGLILKNKGDLEGALRYTQRALEIGEKVYGPEHPDVATWANNVGMSLQAKGDLEGALRYTQRALQILKKTYGPENPLTKRAAVNVAGIRRLIESKKARG